MQQARGSGDSCRQLLTFTDLHLHAPSQVLLRSGSPAPAEPVDPNRGMRALTQEEVMGVRGV